jgi:tetratricopeptide (TPR) repeat protein
MPLGARTVCPRIIISVATLVAAAQPCTRNEARAQSSSLVGKEVDIDGYRNEIPIMMGDQIVARNDPVRVYLVKSVNGDRALIYCPKDGVEGYVPVDRLVALDRAIEYYSEKIGANPSSKHDWNGRGIIWAERGEDDKAIADYTVEIRLDPRDGTGYHNRANSWASKKEYDIAIADYNDSIRFEPEHFLSYSGRGEAWLCLEKYDRALADFEKVLQLKPYWPNAHSELAWIWAACPDRKFRDGKRAVESATKGCELSKWRGYEMLDALAGAYAEAGDFAKAVENVKKAIELRKLRTDRGTKGYERGLARLEKRLALYEKKQAYRYSADDE